MKKDRSKSSLTEVCCSWLNFSDIQWKFSTIHGSNFSQKISVDFAKSIANYEGEIALLSRPEKLEIRNQIILALIGIWIYVESTRIGPGQKGCRFCTQSKRSAKLPELKGKDTRDMFVKLQIWEGGSWENRYNWRRYCKFEQDIKNRDKPSKNQHVLITSEWR